MNKKRILIISFLIISLIIGISSTTMAQSTNTTSSNIDSAEIAFKSIGKVKNVDKNNIKISGNENLNGKKVILASDNDFDYKIKESNGKIITSQIKNYIKHAGVNKKSINDNDFDILNNTYNGYEREMKDFVEYVNTHLIEASNIEKEMLDKAIYMEVDCRYGLSRYDSGNYWAFYNIALLDKNKKDLGISRNDIDGDDLPLDNELDDVIGQYLERNFILKIK